MGGFYFGGDRQVPRLAWGTQQRCTSYILGPGIALIHKAVPSVGGNTISLRVGILLDMASRQQLLEPADRFSFWFCTTIWYRHCWHAAAMRSVFGSRPLVSTQPLHVSMQPLRVCFLVPSRMVWKRTPKPPINQAAERSLNDLGCNSAAILVLATPAPHIIAFPLELPRRARTIQCRDCVSLQLIRRARNPRPAFCIPSALIRRARPPRSA